MKSKREKTWYLYRVQKERVRTSSFLRTHTGMRSRVVVVAPKWSSHKSRHRRSGDTTKKSSEVPVALMSALRRVVKIKKFEKSDTVEFVLDKP